ncbi:MAG: RNA polymerase subunit sigma-24 [Novosphingobium sp.]|jgi:RNA polymerase sigma factor (sigma-70 family)|nr:RNA polymerase subunit sigma-24 [Novosphingobium sp.]|tara:strand:- start:1330 stop:1878 length:549 start_codon:yes stop_codon:yes gene_type:complete
MKSADENSTCEVSPALSDGFLDRLFRSEAPRLARFIRRAVRNHDEVNDLVQDTFVNFVAADPGPAVRNPAAYLTTIARRLLWGHARRQASSSQLRFVNVDEAGEIPIGPEQEWMMEAADVIRRYEQALAELPARTREIFRLSKQEELSYQEIANRLGMTVRGVKYHMRKALLYLDQRVNGDG